MGILLAAVLYILDKLHLLGLICEKIEFDCWIYLVHRLNILMVLDCACKMVVSYL